MAACLLAGLFHCAADSHHLTIAPALAPACLAGLPINEVRVGALGDFPPNPTTVGSLSPGGALTLAIPRGTRVLTVEGLGPSGPLALGRTAPLELDALPRSRLSIGYGMPDALCDTGALNYARSGHRATLLTSGDVLVTGGVDAEGFAVPRLEIYRAAGDAADPRAGFRVIGAATLDARAALGHAVALLPGGDALVTGGAPAQLGRASGIAFEGASRLRPDGTAAAPTIVLAGGPRALHTATGLSDGRVALVGGCSELAADDCLAGRALASTVIYDPVTGGFTDGPPLLRARYDHDALLRGDGTLLLVGGRGEGGASLPAEVFDPDEPRGFDAGLVVGKAASLDVGGALVVGGAHAPSSSASRFLGPAEAPLPLAPLPTARAGHTATALEDGATLVAGGSDGTVLDPSLVLYDARGGVVLPAGSFARIGHSATRLLDGTVLLAGGLDASGSATTNSAIYIRSLVGPFVSLPPLTFDSAADPFVPRRPDRALAQGGRLAISADSAGDQGRPAELALLAGMRVLELELTVLAGRTGAAAAALIVGYRSEADYAFVALAPGEPTALSRVTTPRAGQTSVVASTECVGAPLGDGDLPDMDLAELRLSLRGGELLVYAGSRALLRCAPAPPIARGAVGVGSLRGAVRFDNVAVQR